MSLFCSKKKLKNRIIQLEDAIRSRDLDIENLKGHIMDKKEKIDLLDEQLQNLREDNDRLQEENQKIIDYKNENDKYKEIVENDDKTINSLNEKISSIKKRNRSLAGKVGSLSNVIIRMKEKYERELLHASAIIQKLNYENKRLKNRPSTEELKGYQYLMKINKELRNSITTAMIIVCSTILIGMILGILIISFSL